MIGSDLVTYSYPGPEFAHGGAQPANVNLHVVHDVEAPFTPGMARGLCGPNYFGHGGDPGNPVSIHYLVGPDDICQGTSEEIVAWHVGIGNYGTFGTEQLGFAAMSRAEWLTHMDQLTNLAKLMTDISRRHPLIRPQWLTDDEVVYAWHNKSTPGGHTTHKQMTRVGLGSDHTDPGDGWPADVVMSLVQGVPPSTDWFDMATVDDLRAVVRAELAAQVTDQRINDLVANVLRADEFKLDAERRGEDLFRGVTAVLHEPEFAGWQSETRAAAAKILGTDPPK
jgi:hypothetical protein